MYAGRIKKSLERDAPLRANADDLGKGGRLMLRRACKTTTVPFKPEGRSDVWRAESLTVRQLDGIALDDKEPTVSAWGQDSVVFLGGRFDVVVWDDLG
jgi:hypothetical protein